MDVSHVNNHKKLKFRLEKPLVHKHDILLFVFFFLPSKYNKSKEMYLFQENYKRNS